MGKKNKKTAITPTRQEDFPMWYQAVVKEAELAEMAHVRGCMVIKPWGYAVWENIQYILGNMIKETGAENVYFPLFIPMKYIQKEAEHVDGFAKEMAVVTHHRLKKNEENGLLEPDGELTEPVIVRPTSETIIGETMAQWIKSYRDLPVKVNQWCNVVRWEMRPRVFLRTVEFLWQEGHTAHADKDEAVNETVKMLNIYRDFVENYLGIPLVLGVKPEYDKFPGAVDTYCIEAMMQDGKALQAGTTHYLGEKFAKSANIQYLNNEGELKYAHTTSWGVSTRLMGGLIMTHADDDGMRMPPMISQYQIVIIPYTKDGKEDENKLVMEYVDKLHKGLEGQPLFKDVKIKAKVDERPIGGSDKKWNWIKKGAPIQVEVGIRDIENGVVTYRLRSEASSQKHQMQLEEFVGKAPDLLREIQDTYFKEAKERLQQSIKEASTFDELTEYFSKEDEAAFLLAPYYEDEKEDPRLKDMSVTIRCIPLEQKGEERECILTGRKTNKVAIFARSY